MTQEPWFDWMPTPDPKEFGFYVRVESKEFNPNTSNLVDGVTTYGSLKLRVQGIGTILDRCSDYVYTMAASAGTRGFLNLYFFKPKSDAEKKIPFRTWPKFDQHEWDSIMLSLQRAADPRPFGDYGIVNGQKALITGKRWIVRPEHIEGGAIGTLFTVEEFLSPTQFSIKRYRTPIAKTVAWNYNGERGVFRRCLHGDLELPDAQVTSEAIAGSTVSNIPGVLTGQKFPATNMSRWQRHVVHCDQSIAGGGIWHMIRIWAHPPPLNEPITTDS